MALACSNRCSRDDGARAFPGTVLTHLGSAKDRQAKHERTANDTVKPMKHSMRMFEWGIAGGRLRTMWNYLEDLAEEGTAVTSVE